MPIVKKEGKTYKPLVSSNKPIEKIEIGHFYVLRGDLENNKQYDGVTCNDLMTDRKSVV